MRFGFGIFRRDSMATGAHVLDRKEISTPAKVGMWIFGAALGIGICERISRHGERRGYGDLHTFAGATCGGGVVGNVEFYWSAAFERRGGVWNCFVASGGIDFASGRQSGVCDGVRVAGGGDYLESGDVVVRIAGVEFAHADWIDYRSGNCESIDVREVGNEWSGLGTSDEHWKIAAAFANCGVRGGRAFAARNESVDSE